MTLVFKPVIRQVLPWQVKVFCAVLAEVPRATVTPVISLE